MKNTKKSYIFVFCLVLASLFIYRAQTGMVYGAVTAGTTAVVGTSTTPSCKSASSRDLKIGSYGSAVTELQKVLNMDLGTRVSSSGAGSLGHETAVFGTLTRNAVIKFQEKYAKSVLGPDNLVKGTGFVGLKTRMKVLEVCIQKVIAYSRAIQTQSLVTISSSSSITSSTSEAMSAAARNAFRHQDKYFRSSGGGGAGGGSSVPTPTPTPGPVVNPKPPVATSTPPATTTPPVTPPVPSQGYPLQWGAYVGDGQNDLTTFETLVAKPVNIMATFVGFQDSFPSLYASTVGAKGKTLLIFWEPSVGYDSIINGSQDSAIRSFLAGAIAYRYPIILAPFNEMNLNEEVWGYGQNGNTAAKFITAWKHIHDMLASATNVKFAIDYNNVSVPDVAGNRIADYYPGSAYVDYVGVDGFNFGNPWQSFASAFDSVISEVQSFGKPIYILSTASAAGPNKAAWITDGLGVRVKTYPNVLGWIWFNQNKEADWRVNSDDASLAAFKAVVR